MNKHGLDTLMRAIQGKDRRALARAITLVESSRADHKQDASYLLNNLTAPQHKSLRIGLTGTPGVGKSTFIETFGLMLCDLGHRVAVLAVDPSSRRSGGAILGDKTRMPELSRRKDAFIRPTPSRNALGGVAAQTRSVIAVVEAAGFDITLVETVGVGQSETLVADLTDLFVLLLAPAGGDELQGVKRGIMELADLVLVNKADGDLAAQAKRTAAEYASAMQLLRRPSYTPEGYPKTLTLSARDGLGLEEAWTAMRDLDMWRDTSGLKQQRRQDQKRAAFDAELEAALLSHLKSRPDFDRIVQTQRAAVQDGQALPETAAQTAASQIIAAQANNEKSK